ncbi:unnamed protein product [Schistosoma margrebowiei]|uniref:Uncharacterized protein n=1 Tax=Schistosoma margrebowiei TaxID=48269 RepID=A0A183M490_9TREM|nr:unnamed protein product [Schistosoma margrebowiei]
MKTLTSVENNNPITLDEDVLEEVETLRYLDSIIDVQGGSDADLKSRIGNTAVSQHQNQNLQCEREDTTTAERKSKLSNWFDLPRPDVTEEDRDDLELIRLRRAISSDTHVRRSDGKSAYFQRGVVVDDPGSFYDRLPRKQRGKTLVDELLANAEIMK